MAGAAGPVAVGTAPQVDVPTAKELIEQIHEHIDVAEIGALAGELRAKSEQLSELLGAGRLDGERIRRGLAWTFVGRRRASAIMGARSDAELAAWTSDLLRGDDPVAMRLERFCAAAGPLAGGAAAELAAEWLHFTAPDRHWLWSRWIWSAESRTGALPLLIGEEFELEADGLGASYTRVCQALDALDTSPEAGAFRPREGGRFGTDVLLACTYGVYMRTVLGLKMTQEFNALVPPLGQLARRLLGTYVPHREEVV